MANRFPLIVNPNTQEVQELTVNDNLDLTGNGIYAGGSLGLNGQVLTSNGTSVEWRTVTASGGGGGGLDQDTTYVVEAEELADGANLNLIAGGSGVGTISIKIEDSEQLEFNAPDGLTITPSVKDAGITNAKLKNPSFKLVIGGVTNTINLGDTFTFPSIGNVFTEVTQTLKNKTLENCTISGDPSKGNNISNLPITSLQYSYISINNSPVYLGQNINLTTGGGTGVDTDTTYTLSATDSQFADQKHITLTDSEGVINNVTLIEGDNVQISRSGNSLTISSTDTNTDTNTTYSISSTSLQQGNTYTGAKFNLIDSNSIIDTVNLRNGTGVTVSSTGDSDITFSIGQSVNTTSNVTFNDMNITGSLTVSGALSNINTTNLVVTDKTVTISNGVTNSENADGSGILIGTSNINFKYNHDVLAWEPTTHFNLVSTKTYKIAGNEVLSATRVLGKAVPVGNIVGTLDTQTLSNKTLNSPIISEIINQGTLTLPAPSIADTLVARATADTLTNKSISGNTNTIRDLANNALVNPWMNINGTQRFLGDTFVITASDPYTDEKAQDTIAGSFTNGVHSGISFTYDDTTGRINASVDGFISLDALKSEVSAATDFADFQARIAAL